MKVGFIGIGRMGRGMAANLLKGGHELVVHDARRDATSFLIDAGATWADSPANVGKQVEVVFTSLPGPSEMEQVAIGKDGLADGLSEGSVYFDLTTNSPTTVLRVYQALEHRGISMLDAPVSGGWQGAESGRLALWASGERKFFDKYRSLLEAIADQPCYVGDIGSGSIVKLVNNCADIAIQVVLAEAFTMGVKAGIDPLMLFQAIRVSGAGRTRTFDMLLDAFLPGKFDPPGFTLELARKDLLLAVSLGKECSVPMRMANLTLADLTEAVNRGWGERDSSVVMLLQEERANVNIRVPEEQLKHSVELDSTKIADLGQR